MSATVSIVIPCYNQALYLTQAVESINAQTYSNWECIIINDGSTDSTDEVGQQLSLQDKRVKYYKKDNGGLASARNAGIRQATGEYIQFLDADDLIEKEKLELSINLFKENPAVDFVMSGFVMHHLLESKYILPEKSIGQYKLDFEFILLNWQGKGFNFPIHSPVYKADLVKKFYFNEELKASEDWFFHLQVFKFSGRYATIDKPLAVYRKHGENMTGNHLHTIENLSAANSYIMRTLVEEEDLKIAFFNKVNKVWEEYATELATELINHKTKQLQILASTSYKLGNSLLSPLVNFRRLIKS